MIQLTKERLISQPLLMITLGSDDKNNQVKSCKNTWKKYENEGLTIGKFFVEIGLFCFGGHLKFKKFPRAPTLAIASLPHHSHVSRKLGTAGILPLPIVAHT